MLLDLLLYCTSISQPTTLLTNLQRGNTQTQTPVIEKEEVSLHERAGQGEVTETDLKQGQFKS